MRNGHVEVPSEELDEYDEDPGSPWWERWLTNILLALMLIGLGFVYMKLTVIAYLLSGGCQ